MDGLVLELKRALPVPGERVFRALTEPVELMAWWGPRGFTIPDVRVDLRVGGRYRFTMRPPGGEPFHLSGEYLAIEPTRRLVYTFDWEEPDPDDRTTVVTLVLREVGTGTEVWLRQGEFATEARLALHHDGWTESLEKLHEFVQRGSPVAREAGPAAPPAEPA